MKSPIKQKAIARRIQRRKVSNERRLQDVERGLVTYIEEHYDCDSNLDGRDWEYRRGIDLEVPNA